MKPIAEFLNKIFVLKSHIAYLISVPLFAFVWIVLALEYTGPLAYVAYFLSAYALVVFCIALVRDFSKLGENFKKSRFYKRLCEHPVIGAMILDDSFRIRLSLYFGTFVNLLYVILKISTGIIYKSYWLIFFGLYYLSLAVLRLFIIEKDRKNIFGQADSISDYKRYRECGLILLLLNIILAVITLMAARLRANIEYPGVLIFGMAFYSFYAVITTFVGTIKYRKHESVMFSAAKVASFTAALVSMLSLEIAMTSRFGAEDFEFRKNMTAITGTGVFLIVFFLAVRMIIRASKLLKASL